MSVDNSFLERRAEHVSDELITLAWDEEKAIRLEAAFARLKGTEATLPDTLLTEEQRKTLTNEGTRRTNHDFIGSILFDDGEI